MAKNNFDDVVVGDGGGVVCCVLGLLCALRIPVDIQKLIPNLKPNLTSNATIILNSYQLLFEYPPIISS